MNLTSNSAQKIRHHLGLNKTEAGELLLGHKGKVAYDVWARIESGRGNVSRPLFCYIDLLHSLLVLAEENVPDCHFTLDYVTQEMEMIEYPEIK